MFAKCGVVKEDDERRPRVKVYRDRDSGMPKGDGLVTYLKDPSVRPSMIALCCLGCVACGFCRARGCMSELVLCLPCLAGRHRHKSCACSDSVLAPKLLMFWDIPIPNFTISGLILQGC